jgi:hypothetical protein
LQWKHEHEHEQQHTQKQKQQHKQEQKQEDPIEFSDTEQESTIGRDSIEDSGEEKKATKTKNGRPFLLPPLLSRLIPPLVPPLAKPKRRKLGKKKETYSKMPCLTFK